MQLWRTRIEDIFLNASPALRHLSERRWLYRFLQNGEATGANPSYPCCSFHGSVVALEAITGRVQWKSYTIVQEAKPTVRNSFGLQMRGPSGAAVWSAPKFAIVTRTLYVTTGDNYSDPPTDTSDAILAFNADTGELVWSRQMTTGDAYNIACVRTARANCRNPTGPTTISVRPLS